MDRIDDIYFVERVRMEYIIEGVLDEYDFLGEKYSEEFQKVIDNEATIAINEALENIWWQYNFLKNDGKLSSRECLDCALDNVENYRVIQRDREAYLRRLCEEDEYKRAKKAYLDSIK